MEPPCLAKELRKQLLWLTLACLRRNLDPKRIDCQVGQEVSLYNYKTIENGRGFNRKWGWLQKFHAQNPPPTNPTSATGLRVKSPPPPISRVHGKTTTVLWLADCLQTCLKQT